MSEHFFEQLLAIMAASLAATVILQRLRMPNIIAYLVAGSVIGPHLLGWVDQPSDFAFLAEFGVVFLLFSLGLEFSLPKLLALRSSVFGLGGVQVTLCTLVFGGAVWLWGTSIESAIIIAGALALSSTAIVTKELTTLRQIHTRPGQLSVGVLLFQDLAAVIFLILVPVLAGDTASIWDRLGWALVKGLLLVALLLSVGKWLLPALYKEVARAQSDEIFVLSTLVIVMLASWITHSFQLSMALGAFVIGMMLGESPFRHQINSDIRSFKDILLGLFFVTIGMSVQIELLVDYWPRLIAFTLGLIAVKALLIGVMVRISGDSAATAIQTGFNLAQAGEFGLALLTLAMMHQVLPQDQASFITILAILTMALGPLLIRYSGKFREALNGRLGPWFSDATLATEQHQVTVPGQDHVIIGGFGRVGKTIARLLDSNHIDYIAIDQDVELVSRERSRDLNVIYGDCSNINILRSCHIHSARIAVLTFRSISAAKTSLEQIRASGVSIPIIVRCHEQGNFEELVSLGADCVVPEMLEASLTIGMQVLNLLGIPESDADRLIELERAEQLNSR